MKWGTKTQTFADAQSRSRLKLVREEDYLLNFTLIEAEHELDRWERAQQNAKRKRRNNGLSSYLNNGRWQSSD